MQRRAQEPSPANDPAAGKGHSSAEVFTITAYGKRWIEPLRARYNSGGLQVLGDQRRGNGTTATILTETVLAKLRERLQTPPDDGGGMV